MRSGLRYDESIGGAKLGKRGGLSSRYCTISAILQKFAAMNAQYVTLGCKLNYAETAALAGQLVGYGIRRAEAGEAVDVCVVNTCAVTSVAEQKCRQAVSRLRRQHPQAAVVVMGCGVSLLSSPQSGGEEGTWLHGCLVIDNRHKAEAAQLIARFVARDQGSPATAETGEWQQEGEGQFAPACAKGERTRWWLKVQDGCNHACSYCTIPLARGRSRNPSVEELVAQAEQVAAAGGREIVLTGVNIGQFRPSFLSLCQALDAVAGIARYRISSIEPELLSDELIAFVARSRAFMPHFHIPLQAGSDAVLRLMRRAYTTALFRHKVEEIRRLMPHAFIGVDVIAGMRGETAALFDEGFRFIESLPLSQLHVFPYSERPHTAALSIAPVVPPAEKHARAGQLIALSEQMHTAFRRQFVGTMRPALIEHGGSGYTDNYLRVSAPPAAREGDIVEARVS